MATKNENQKKLKKLATAYNSMKSLDEKMDFLDAIAEKMMMNEKKEKK